MKKVIGKLAAVLILSGLNLAGGASFAAEFEVLDRFSVDGYTVLRGSADVSGGVFTVGASTFVVKDGNVGIGIANPAVRFEVAGGSSTLRGSDAQKDIAAFGSASGDFKVVIATSGNVGIGTTNPVANLEVAGGVKIGAVTACTSDTAGTIRWYDGHLSVCNGANWRQLDNQPPPTITSITPASGIVTGGTAITIIGTGFSSGLELTIGGAAATGIALTGVTQITAVTPAGTAGARELSITNSDGQYITGTFTYNPLPTSGGSVSPASGTEGTVVTITGTDFVNGLTVTFGGLLATTNSVTATQIVAVAPANASPGAKDITITNPDSGAVTLTSGFTYLSPTVTGVSPSYGIQGTVITITGTSFVNTTGLAVAIGGVTATGFTWNSATQITATAPASTTSGAKAVTVTNRDSGSGTKSDGFTYTVYATGGTESTVGSYRIHKFTGSSTLTVNTGGNVEVLAVAGGGGGDGGGGGGGGLLYNASLAVGAQAYSLTVGAGGAAPYGVNNTATSGSDSVFASLTAIGGGAGRYSVNSLAGGSGGGGPSSATGTGGTGVSGQGKAGGSGVLSGGGGGGGAAAAGASGAAGVGGAGGIGLPYSISGTPAYYSGGGGGGYTSGGSGGEGGGGGGGSGASGSAGSGTANTGGGGGGVYNSYPAGAGGSGIVIIRYPIVPGLTVPTVATVSPSSGQQGTPITITGTGFAANATVTIGVAAATDVSWVSATEIRAKAPVSPASGAAAVTVTNPADKSYGVKTDGFTYSQVALQSLASALNGTNSGSNNLAGMRDGGVASYAGYSLNGYENDWSYGYDFTLSYTVTSIRFYSVATSERVRYFLIEQWNGSAWVKVPIKSWSDGATAYSSTEGQAANADGWNSVTFAPVSASKFRIRFTGSWNVGDGNAGLSEMEMYGY